MPVLRSREIAFKTSIDKTLEKEPPLDPSTPLKSDAMAVPIASSAHPSSSSAAAAPRRRSLRLASLSPPISETVTSRKRKTRVAQSPIEGESRVSVRVAQSPIEGESMVSVYLRSGTRIEKRQAVVEVDSKNRLDFEAIEVRFEENGEGSVADPVEKSKGEIIVDDELKGKGKLVETRVLEERGSMNLRSSPRFAKRRPIVEVDLNKRLDGGEKSQSEENGEVSEAVSVEKSEDQMVIDDDEKGKGKLVVEEGQSSIYNNEVTQSSAREVFEGGRSRRTVKTRMTKESRKESGRKVALNLASKYAFFKADEESSEEEEEEDLAVNADQNEDWPGPFSTAMKIIRDREQILIARELNSSSKKNHDAGVKIQWSPSKVKKVKTFGKSPPSLHDLCMKVLCDNAEEVESLYGVPDAIKHRFVSHLCRSRKMGSRVLGLLVSGSPTDIHLSDCSWGTEGEFEEAFGGCNTEKLKVLELDISGRCLPDYVLQGILARSIKNLPLLTKISLRGNYRLSDDGLNAIVSSAPSLSCINLSQCSLISSAGIINVAEKLESVLKELYIDECQDVDAMLILPSLMKLKNLEVLSVAEIETVSNKFVRKLVSSCGTTIKELGLSGCRKLTSGSMKVIGESCPLLRSLDLWNLNRLNDLAIGYLANGCRSIQKLKLRRNAFSDEALAAFLEASGGSLIELSVNNFAKVGQQTAIAISRRCSSTLKTLDLSFCRNMSDEALGLIVDSCSNLQILKLFGCTQVTNVFMAGHSNPAVHIVGSKGPVLDRIQLPEYL